MSRPSQIMERLIAGICLVIAFVVMASVFTPGGTQAENEHGPSGRPAASTDPHAALRSLGTIEDGCYRVDIYATEHGPRYTIFDLERGAEVGTLLPLEKASEWFPDLNLPDMNRHDASGPLMMADPDRGHWPD